MSACERCWSDAYRLSRCIGGHQVDHYRNLLAERDGTACADAHPAPTTRTPEESPDE